MFGRVFDTFCDLGFNLTHDTVNKGCGKIWCREPICSFSPAPQETMLSKTAGNVSSSHQKRICWGFVADLKWNRVRICCKNVHSFQNWKTDKKRKWERGWKRKDKETNGTVENTSEAQTEGASFDRETHPCTITQWLEGISSDSGHRRQKVALVSQRAQMFTTTDEERKTLIKLLLSGGAGVELCGGDRFVRDYAYVPRPECLCWWGVDFLFQSSLDFIRCVHCNLKCLFENALSPRINQSLKWKNLHAGARAGVNEHLSDLYQKVLMVIWNRKWKGWGWWWTISTRGTVFYRSQNEHGYWNFSLNLTYWTLCRTAFCDTCKAILG